MTKKTTTKANVAKTATTVANKATETKRPTVKSLQQQVVQLEEKLFLVDNLAQNLEIDILSRDNKITSLKGEITAYNITVSNLERKVKELENRSILAQILFAISKPFR